MRTFHFSYLLFLSGISVTRAFRNDIKSDPYALVDEIKIDAVSDVSWKPYLTSKHPGDKSDGSGPNSDEKYRAQMSVVIPLPLHHIGTLNYALWSIGQQTVPPAEVIITMSPTTVEQFRKLSERATTSSANHTVSAIYTNDAKGSVPACLRNTLPSFYPPTLDFLNSLPFPVRFLRVENRFLPPLLQTSPGTDFATDLEITNSTKVKEQFDFGLARLVGAKHAETDLIAFFSPQDYMHPQRIRIIERVLTSVPMSTCHGHGFTGTGAYFEGPSLRVRPG